MSAARDPVPLRVGALEIGLGMDAQGAYEDGMALARAWLAFCAELERSGRVEPAPGPDRPAKALRALGPGPHG